MTTTTAWIIAAALVLVGLGLGWWVIRSRGRADEAPSSTETQAERVAAPVEAAVRPVASPLAPHVAPAPRPAPPSASSSPPAPAPAPQAPAPLPPPPPPPAKPPAPPPPPVSLAPPTVIMVPPPRPAAPVIERVLALEPAGEGEWASGIALPLTPVQSAAVATALASEGSPAFYAIDFAPGATLSVARADLAFMRSLAAASAASAGRSLDGSAAAVVAAVSIAGLANERFLEALGDEMRELKALLAGIAPKTDGLADGRLKALVQDLSRFAREARENYASAIGKSAFRERIEEAAERALIVWNDAVERAEAARQPLDALAKAPRFGEVQVEKALALMRALHEQKRIQEIGARTLAAANTLRIAVGDTPAMGPADPLVSAAAALQGSIEQDRDLFARLVDCEKAARGDPYVGKGEFEANRAALRKLLERPPAERFAVTLERIEATRVAEPLDTPRSGSRRLLIRAGGDGAAMRLAAG